MQITQSNSLGVRSIVVAIQQYLLQQLRIILIHIGKYPTTFHLDQLNRTNEHECVWTIIISFR